MDTQKYRNKAFLSYRHVSRDEKDAALLQRALENYPVPETIRSYTKKPEEQITPAIDAKEPHIGIKKKKGFRDRPSRGVGRIFRDATDLGARADLTEELRRELEDSEYLIVLCSEKTAESRWVSREISAFLQSHSADKILPVVTEGEPEAVLKAVFGEFEGMSHHLLACDLRQSAYKGLPGRHFPKDEISRLAAALLDCPFNELVNRRRRYENRRMAAVVMGLFLLMAVTASYYAYTSSQIRRSYRDKQIAESESLAVQSETALGQGFRFDAIQYAMDALPADKQEGPVTGQAVQALQKAAAAYVPEGSRKLAQTAEYRVPGRIIDYQVFRFGERPYLSVLYGNHELILWKADTGEAVFDSRKIPSLQKDGEIEAEAFCTQAVMGNQLFFTKSNHLTGIDIETGNLLWQEDEEADIKMQILDVKEDAILILVSGVRNSRLFPQATEGARDGMRSDEVVQELQIRSTKDGALLYCRKTKEYVNDQKNVYVKNAFFAGLGNKILFLDNIVNPEGAGPVEREADDPGMQDRLYLLDPRTGEEELLMQACRICDFRITEDHQLLTVSLDQNHFIEELQKNDTDSPAIRYASAQTGRFIISGRNLQTGKVQWETISDNGQDYHIRLDSDLQIKGERTCLFSSGTHMDLLAQKTGKILYEIDYPGLPVSWKKGDSSGPEELEAVLEDGSIAAFSFSSGVILKENDVFPEQIAKLKEADNELYILCSQDIEHTSGDRIYVFGKEVYDPDTAYIHNYAGAPVKIESTKMQFGGGGTQCGYVDECIAADKMFILLEKEQGALHVSRTDASTGETLWDFALGENAEYIGYAEDAGILVFRDHILSSRELAERYAKGETLPEEEWNLLHVKDGHADTILGMEKEAFGTDQVVVRNFGVSKDALILSVTVREEEVWLLRYPLAGGGAKTIRLPAEKLKTLLPALFPVQIISSPDGNSTVCCFSISEYTEKGTVEYRWSNLLINWKTQKITELPGTPPVESLNSPEWSPEGSRIAFRGKDGDTVLISCEGTVLYEKPAAKGKTVGMGFWRGELFTVDQVGFDIHFRIPQKEVDFLLPVGKTSLIDQEAQALLAFFTWEVQSSKMLLKFGSQSFLFSPETGIIEGVIEKLVNYNPQTDTMILLDKNENAAIAHRYEWEELVEKGGRELQKLHFLAP